MASSGSCSTNAYEVRYLVFSWNIKSQSIADNNTVISWTLKGAGSDTNIWYITSNVKLNINGSTVFTAAGPISLTSGYQVASGTTTIAHNADGNKSFSAYVEAGIFYTAVNCTGSGSWDLTAIPRATTPTISAATTTMGNSLTITLNPASSSFKHKITYAFGGTTGLTNGLSIGSGFSVSGNTTVTFTPPTTLGNSIPSATSGVCTIYCTTYDAKGNAIGVAKTLNVTLNIPSYSPTVTSVGIVGNNLLSGVYVQGKSTATITVNASSSYGATIKSYSTIIDNKTYTGASFTTSELSNGTKSAVVTVIDTRGKTVTYTSSSITVYEYSHPSITNFVAVRGTDNTTVVASLTGTYASVNSKNVGVLTITLNGVTKTVTSGTSVTFTGLSTDKTYVVVGAIKDSYTSVNRSINISTVYVTLDFNASGKGLAIGKVSEKNALEVNMPTEFLQGVTGTISRATADANGNNIANSYLLKSALLNLVFPVGAVYISATNTNPSTFLGGTWVSFGAGQTLVGVNTSDTDFNTVLKTGGAKTVTLTTTQIPSHNHDIYEPNAWSAGIGVYATNLGYGSSWYGASGYESSAAGKITTKAVGGGGSHNNLQPYITVYFWRRTS